MFNIFKNKSTKTTKELVEEIHNEFNTASDRLLEEAKSIINQKAITIEISKNNLDAIPEKDKAERLKRFGFKNSSIVTDKEQKEKEYLEKIKQESIIKEAKEKVAEALNYFSNKYPLTKFIIIEEVETICAKYNLVYGDVSLFKGFIPEKNLRDIENFKLQDEDYALNFKGNQRNYSWQELKVDSWLRVEDYNNLAQSNLDYSSIKYHQERLRDKFNDDWTIAYHNNCIQKLYSCDYSASDLKEHRMPLEIAAPIKDMNTEGMEVSKFKLIKKIVKQEIPDPVVLQPCVWSGQKCYAIVTAWGDEQYDPIVFNEKFN